MAKSLHERFQEKIEVIGDCWEWRGAVNSKGYGLFWFDGRSCSAHRISYELHVGPIPDGLEIDHLCRVTHCVNPSHLEAVTHQENILRGDAPPALQARRKFCTHGHRFDGATKDGRRRLCLECERDRKKRWRDRQPVEELRAYNREAMRAFRARRAG